MARSQLVAALGAALILGACASPSDDAVRSSKPDPTTAAPSVSPRGKPRATTPAPPENPAPDFSFETFEGDTLSLAELRGTPIVLNFWESW